MPSTNASFLAAAASLVQVLLISVCQLRLSCRCLLQSVCFQTSVALCSSPQEEIDEVQGWLDDVDINPAEYEEEASEDEGLSNNAEEQIFVLPILPMFSVVYFYGFTPIVCCLLVF